MQYTRKQKNIGLITGFVLLWNSGFVGAEFGLPYAGPFTFMFYRYLASTLLIACYLFITKQLYWIGWRCAWHQMIIGVLAHGVWLSCVLIAIDHGVPAGIVALIVALQPLATGALSGKVVNEPTPWNRWLGLVIGFIGVAVPVLSRIDFNNPYDIFAWLIPLLSVIAITAASLFQRKLDLKKDYPDIHGGLQLYYQTMATTLALILPAVLTEKLAVEWNPVFASSLIWLIMGVSLGAYNLMWILIDRLDATRVASLFYLGPPVTMLMAWLALGDKVETIDLIGLTIVLLGVMLTYLKHPAILFYLRKYL
ncbi:MAG TPA: DMT family transporter [Prolixibacteraceae bacterium]|nr:DMT family transporter [Prolixibacteraceae bacterium]